MERSRVLDSLRALYRGAFMLLMPVMILSCGDARGPEEEPASDASHDRAAAAAPEATTGEATMTLAAYPDVTRSIIRRASLELSVTDTDEAAGEITALAERLGGYVGDLNARRRDDLVFYDLTLRVPTARFGEAMAELKGLATRVESETRSTEDVTEQVVDLEARLETLHGVEVELRALLSESRRQGRDVAAIMEIYRQLTEIRTQIEQLDAHLANLERATALSTIQVTLAPDVAGRPILTDDWRPGDTVRKALGMLIGVLQGLADVAIFAAVFLLPLGLLAWAGFAVRGRILRRRAIHGPAA